jgi:hypothetical protein
LREFLLGKIGAVVEVVDADIQLWLDEAVWVDF